MKKMRKMMATLVALTLALSTMSISVLAAEKADIEGGGDYLGEKITVSYGDQNYGFTQKNGKWEADDGFAELPAEALQVPDAFLGTSPDHFFHCILQSQVCLSQS